MTSKLAGSNGWLITSPSTKVRCGRPYFADARARAGRFTSMATTSPHRAASSRAIRHRSPHRAHTRTPAARRTAPHRGSGCCDSRIGVQSLATFSTRLQRTQETKSPPRRNGGRGGLFLLKKTSVSSVPQWWRVSVSSSCFHKGRHLSSADEHSRHSRTRKIHIRDPCRNHYESEGYNRHMPQSARIAFCTSCLFLALSVGALAQTAAPSASVLRDMDAAI